MITRIYRTHLDDSDVYLLIEDFGLQGTFRDDPRNVVEIKLMEIDGIEHNVYVLDNEKFRIVKNLPQFNELFELIGRPIHLGHGLNNNEMKFEDLTNAQLKQIISRYNKHIKISNYSKLVRDDLLKLVNKHFKIDKNIISLKHIEPFNFDVPTKKKAKPKAKVKPKEKVKLIEKVGDDYLIDDNGKIDIVSYEKYNSLKGGINKSQIIFANDELKKVVNEIITIKSPYTFGNEKNKLNDMIEKIINSVSKNKIRNEDSLASIIRESYVHGFYPTPTKCLKVFEKDIKDFNNILEPTAGLGYILNFIRSINPNAKLTAIEYNAYFIEILRHMNPDTIINPDDTRNFLQYFPKTNEYDMIIINPPFANGTDKKYYYDFLFHSLFILNKSKFKYEKELIFISPSITKSNQINISMDDIIKSIPKKKLNDIFKRHKKFISDDLDKFDIFSFNQCEKIGICNEFYNTKVKADMYRFIIV